MDKKVTGIISYLSLVGWLIAYLAGDKEGAKFHLNQSLVVMIASIILQVFGFALGYIPIIGGIIRWALGIVMVVFWILGLIYACQDKEQELPVIGSIRILK